MQKEWDESPDRKCPLCGGKMLGYTGWGQDGEIHCERGDYRGYAWSNYRRIPNYATVVSQ